MKKEYFVFWRENSQCDWNLDAETFESEQSAIEFCKKMVSGTIPGYQNLILESKVLIESVDNPIQSVNEILKIDV